MSTATAEQMAHNTSTVTALRLMPTPSASSHPTSPSVDSAPAASVVRTEQDAIRDYTATKSIWVGLSGQTRDPFTLG